MKTTDMLHLVAESSLNMGRMVLPDDEKHPLLNRQIVYTGITRAKKRAVIVGNREGPDGGAGEEDRARHRHCDMILRII